ncbi:MAG: hypothetical protein M1838_003973 [Thelocarpon superellum]|nr:MAG: hypothetical protein M1838_003973 [Thelocarpon superellum]
MANPPPPSPPVDLRALEYLSPVDDNLLCSVCHCAFITPVMMSKCEHIFCAECFDRASRHQKGICPFCRTRLEGDIRSAPRALSNMADDLRVRCPMSKQGCDVITARGSVQAHVDKYCGYAEILHCREDSHSSECPEMVVGCGGAPLGCAYQSRRATLSEHTSTCAFARLEPVIRAQNERIHGLETENKLMRRKWDSFGVGDFPDQMADSSRNSIFDTRALSPPDTDLTHHSTNNPSANAPFDSAIHHLLSSYESLRSDIDRLSTSMSDLDARHSMLQMNESLRIKEDFSHLNAVIGSMRVQLHWLMSTRLQGPQGGHPRAGSAAAGSSSAAAGSSDSAYSLLSAPGRKLSDTPRQDTKL